MTNAERLKLDNSESRERLITVDIEPVDVGRIRGLQTILRMFKDPENREHLAGITPRTTIFELRDYYREPGRNGFVGLSDKEGLVGVYDLSGPEVTRLRRGGQDVVLTLGLLNRMCVRTDFQGRGIGDQLTKDALRRAHNEYGWSNVLAGIVMDAETTRIIQDARRQGDKSRENELLENLKANDPRIKLFVVRNGFVSSGFHPNVTVGGQVREVMLISHPHPDLILPQSEGK